MFDGLTNRESMFDLGVACRLFGFQATADIVVLDEPLGLGCLDVQCVIRLGDGYRRVGLCSHCREVK
jgi:hypothetical protein